jgi:hypothetical protein
MSFKKAAEYNQNKIDVVYSQCQKIETIFKSNQWKNEKCFLIGGGESVNKWDLNKLTKVRVIGVNKAFLRYSYLDILYFMDIPLYEAIKQRKIDEFEKEEVYKRWQEFKGVKVCLSPLNYYPADRDIYFIKRSYIPLVSREITKVYGGACSGFGALMLAIILGANPIYLLGYDLKVENNKTHWHKGYKNQKVEEFKNNLITYKKQFELFSKIFKSIGISIFIVGDKEDTALTCFPIISFEEALK